MENKNYRDDYCGLVNDGFGCMYDENIGLECCLECQHTRLLELLEAYHNLLEITEKK